MIAVHIKKRVSLLMFHFLMVY